MTALIKRIDYDYSQFLVESDLQQRCNTLLATFEQQGGKGVLLIDPAPFLQTREDEPFPQLLLTEYKSRAVVAKIYHPKFDTYYAPWLIDIANSQDVALLKASMAQSLAEIDPSQLIENRGRIVCGWLFSPYQPTEIAEHIAKTAVQSFSTDLAAVLRIYDPAVNSIVWSLLDSWQQSRLLGPIAQWCHLDGDGALVSRYQTRRVATLSTFSLALSSSTVTSLIWSGAINRALRRYRETQRYQTRWSETDAIQIMHNVLLRISTLYGFNLPQDLEACALHSLVYHPEFDSHPRVQACLSDRSVSPNSGYIERIYRLTRDDWQVVVEQSQQSDVKTDIIKEY